MKISSSDQGGEGTHHIDQLDESQSKGYLDLLGHVLHGSDQLIVAPEQVPHQPLLVPRAHTCNTKSSVGDEKISSSPPSWALQLLQGDMYGGVDTVKQIAQTTALVLLQLLIISPECSSSCELYSTVFAPYLGQHQPPIQVWTTVDF